MWFAGFSGVFDNGPLLGRGSFRKKGEKPEMGRKNGNEKNKKKKGAKETSAEERATTLNLLRPTSFHNTLPVTVNINIIHTTCSTSLRSSSAKLNLKG